MSRKRILFVPATKRNAQQLALYAEALAPDFECAFLRTRLFSDNSDIGTSIPGFDFPIVTDDFLLQGPHRSEWAKLKATKRLHGAYREFLRKQEPALVVVGWDNDAIGKWTTFVARDAGCRTLGCQEGGWQSPLAFPLSVRTKILLLNTLLRLSYKGAKVSQYYQNADYTALWGDFDKREAVKRGLKPQRAFVVGDPRIPQRKAGSPPPASDSLAVLYLDFPSTALPKGTVDLGALQQFRKQIVSAVCQAGQKLIYKMHPFTPESEREAIRSITDRFPGCEICIDGVAEDLYSRASACVTFPSSCVYSALAAGLPLIFVHPRFRAFTNIILDPARRYGAGITINTAKELPNALRTIEERQWQVAYWGASRTAAEDLVGPLDGNAAARFRDVVHALLRSQDRNEDGTERRSAASEEQG